MKKYFIFFIAIYVTSTTFAQTNIPITSNKIVTSFGTFYLRHSDSWWIKMHDSIVGRPRDILYFMKDGSAMQPMVFATSLQKPGTFQQFKYIKKFNDYLEVKTDTGEVYIVHLPVNGTKVPIVSLKQ